MVGSPAKFYFRRRARIGRFLEKRGCELHSVDQGELMRVVLLTGILSAFFLMPPSSVTLAAQGGGGVEAAVMGGESARAMTPFEEFADRLKLDQKTQVPAVAELFNAAAANAAPFGVELLQLRQKLLNLELAGQTAETKPVLDAIAVASARMSRIEATTFAKIYALLKPNQQSRAPQAFAQMAGFFQATPSAGRGGRGGR
jgi:hypothetical protein